MSQNPPMRPPMPPMPGMPGMPPMGFPGMPPMPGMPPFRPRPGMPMPPFPGMPMPGMPGMPPPPGGFPGMPLPGGTAAPAAPAKLKVGMPKKPYVPRSDVPPNQTLYVNNINERVQMHDLKKEMTKLFSKFGKVLDVHAKKTLKTRGQAFIVFEKLEDAQKAMMELQGYMFHSKPILIQYALSKSDVVSKANGTFIARPKRVVDAPAEEVTYSRRGKKDADEKMAENSKSGSAPPPRPSSRAQPAARIPSLPPNKKLFIEGLPEKCTPLMLSMLFTQYPGYKEARLVPAKPGIAFVEFENMVQSSQAKDSLQGFKITQTHPMRITFMRQ